VREYKGVESFNSFLFDLAVEFAANLGHRIIVELPEQFVVAL
jgi:hypothetical protein